MSVVSDQTQPSPPYLPIGDYGVIGNLHTAALVSKRGSLDFLCFPRFDSGSVFAKLLDAERGGGWSITPRETTGLQVRQYYEPYSAVLVTRYTHDAGICEVTDFMPPVDDEDHCQVIRRVEALVGHTELDFDFEPRYPYGRGASRLDATSPGEGIALSLDEHDVVLHGVREADIDTGSDDHDADADSAERTGFASDGGLFRIGFRLEAGADASKSTRYFVFQSANCEIPDEDDVAGFGESLLVYTREYWRTWTKKIKYDGDYREPIYRSAITLKLCTSAKFGSSVAAVTFGLPEAFGGELNWDYRYAWIRDSAFTMYAMLRLGLSEEAHQFIGWIEARCAELQDAADLELMYRVDGTCDLEESEVDLEGYRGSRPVRIGNGAAGQRQLDIYGELIDTVFIYDGHAHEITYAFWQHLTTLIDFVCDTWREGDQGIWENRDEPRAYTMSRVMAWVAIDRGIRIAQHRGFPADLQRWFGERNAIYRAIYEEHFDADADAWTQYKGTDEMDASLLMMPLVRFVAPEEPKWVATLERIAENLVDDALVLRYRTDGEDEQDEGYFSICSCWYIECLAKAGRTVEAERLLTKFLSYGNHLGLYSEELHVNGSQLGNFPQAFTHLGLISAILQLEGQKEAEVEGPQG